LTVKLKTNAIYNNPGLDKNWREVRSDRKRRKEKVLSSKDID